MRLFRKFRPWHTKADLHYKLEQRRIEAMPLIYEDNRIFLNGSREKLSWPRESFENLEASIGITRPGCALGAGCRSIFGVGLGITMTFAGIVVLGAAIDLFLQSPHLTPETATIAVWLPWGMFLLLFVGPGFMMQVYLAERNWGYITSLYNQLLAQGQIVEGTIVSIEQAMIEKVVTPEVILHYRFTVPGQPGEYEGQYKLLPDQTFAPGHKVTVLYLNRFVQVLL